MITSISPIKKKLLFLLLPDAPHVLSRHIAKVAKTTPQSISVLDIGGGSGVLWKEVQTLSGDHVCLKITIVDSLPIATGPNGVLWERRTGSAPDCMTLFEDSSFDFVTAFEVIEHLPKHDGYSLMYEMERVAKWGFGISTPNGFMWQPPSPNNLGNKHVSGWSSKDFRDFGMTKIFFHSRTRFWTIVASAGRLVGLPLFAKNSKAFPGLSAWRWTTRNVQNQPHI